MKKIISVLICALLIVCVFASCGSRQLIIYDAKNQLLINFDGELEYDDDGRWAYIDYVALEASEIIADIENCSIEKAEKLLFKNKYSVHTYYDKLANEAVLKTYSSFAGGYNFGCAITDLNGRLISVFSSVPSQKEKQNFASSKTSPYSAFKPLSVYAPAIEKGLINWSTVFKDSPFKKVETSSGSKQNWPQNASGTFSYENETVYEAIRMSLNTVAVKTLDRLGVGNSIEFLKKNFNISLDYEENKAAMHGEEEILGNIALGYLDDGVSPIDMAGFYEIFATGGSYIRPTAIHKICDANGKVIYQNKAETKRVISKETADIMNKLMQGVTTAGATGEAAHSDDFEVAGKTGTGDQNSGNWFVGVTPEYSCAVWHSDIDGTNRAAEFFSGITDKIGCETKEFEQYSSLEKKAYCAKSGKLFSIGCGNVDLGYYAKDNIPKNCSGH